MVATYGRGASLFKSVLNPETIYPEGFQTEADVVPTGQTGVVTSGQIEQLLAGDDRRMTFVTSSFSATSLSATLTGRTGVPSVGTGSDSKLKLTVESNALNANGLRVDLFNFSTGAFDTAGHATPTATDSTVTFQGAASARDYIGPAREVRVRFTWTKGSSSTTGWAAAPTSMPMSP